MKGFFPSTHFLKGKMKSYHLEMEILISSSM